MADQLTRDGKLVALALEFDLPFALLVPDGFGTGRTPDYNDFQFAIQDLPVTLRFSRMVRTDKSTIVDLRRPQEAVSHTRVQLWFDGATLQERTGSSDYRAHADQLIELATGAVNRYVALYRELTGSHWLRGLTRRDIPEFAFVGVLEDGRQITLLYETPSDSSEVLTPAAEQTLRERFVAAYDPDPLGSLALTVRDLFERGDYWQAAVAVSLLCEAKTARLLREHFGPVSQPAQLRTCVPAVDDPTSSIGAMYARWTKAVGGFRDQIARGEQPAIGEKEAEDAIVAVWGFLEELDRVLHSQLGEPKGLS